MALNCLKKTKKMTMLMNLKETELLLQQPVQHPLQQLMIKMVKVYYLKLMMKLRCYWNLMMKRREMTEKKIMKKMAQ